MTGFTVTGAAGADGRTPPPAELVLHGNFPDPFRRGTTIEFTCPRAMPVDLRIHDAAGRLVRTLLSGTPFAAGRHRIAWDGRDRAGREVPAGVYLIRLRAAGNERSDPTVVVR